MLIEVLAMRKLILLGTGNAMVTKCFNTCFALNIDDEYFLVDAGGGNGILAQLEKAQIDMTKIHHLFITHAHTDHVLGVFWVVRKIATLMNQGKYEGKLHIYCHDKVKMVVETIANLTLKKKDLAQIGKNIIFDVVEDGDQREILNMQVIFFDILSTKEKQFGFSAEFADGMNLCCLGDEPYNEVCEIYAQNADYLLSEAFCLYGDRDIFKPYEKHHSTVKEACELAEQLQVKNLILYHTEDKHIDKRKELYTDEGKQYYYGNLYVPDDLDVINLK